MTISVRLTEELGVAGVGVNTSDGIFIESDSPIWSMEPSLALDVLRRARDIFPIVEEAQYADWLCCSLTGGRSHDQMVLRDEPKALLVLRRIQSNPYAGYVKAKCAALLEAIEEWETRKAENARVSRVAKRSLRKEVIMRDGGRCRYCGDEVSVKAAHIDHLIPYSLGGLTEKANLVTACVRCNHRKAGKTLEQAGMKLLALG